MKIIGIVQNENPKDSGTVFFTLGDSHGQLLPCRSGAGYESVKPKAGDKVAIVGHKIADLITKGDSHEFFYQSLEILPR